MLGSDQHCCRKPTSYEPCKREKNVFLLQPAARVSFRSCYGSALLDRGFSLCGLCLLLRVGSASGFPEGCPQVLSPSATTRQAPWRGKKCAYLWRRAPPRARPRDVNPGSRRRVQLKTTMRDPSDFVCALHSRRRLFSTSPLVVGRRFTARRLCFASCQGCTVERVAGNLCGQHKPRLYLSAAAAAVARACATRAAVPAAPCCARRAASARLAAFAWCSSSSVLSASLRSMRSFFFSCVS